MKENESTVLVNAITGLYQTTTESGNCFRVVVRDYFKNYVDDSNDNRVLRNVRGFLVNPSVMFAYIREYLPYVGVVIDKVKQEFAKAPASPNIASYVKFDGDNKPQLDYDALLNSLLANTPIKMQLEFHAAGEMELTDDGREIPHKKDKFNISIIDAEYNPIIAPHAKAYDEAEAARVAKANADLVATIAALGIG